MTLRSLLVDFNSYFASVEQQVEPRLRGKPIGVVPMLADTTVCIAASVEAKQFGVKTGTKVGDAKKMCPGIEFVVARHEIYIDFHHRAVATVDSIVPVMEAGQGDVVDEDSIAHREIGNGVWLEPAYGHSPGCCTVNAQADGPPGVFWGDVIHHPVQLIRHDLPFAFDTDGATACGVRKATMERLADSDTLCFPAHFRRTSAGYVKRDGDAFRYEWIDNT